MTWQQDWVDVFGETPPDPTSREVSVQEVLAALIAGQRCAWFETYQPTDQGRAFLQGLWECAFGSGGPVSWFVSEFELPVPSLWRADIPFTYRCPDFACGGEKQVLIVELKTERGSYSARQMADYLRLARHKLPDCRTDVVLLAPHRPGAMPSRDERQRYGELTWADVVELLPASFPGGGRAQQLTAFLLSDLARPLESPGGIPAPRHGETGHDDDAGRVARCQAAVMSALQLAPDVAAAKLGDHTNRGIDVAFATVDDARRAQQQVAQALQDADFGPQVSVWLWQITSGGQPTTDAGAETGRELRLAPRKAASS